MAAKKTTKTVAPTDAATAEAPKAAAAPPAETDVARIDWRDPDASFTPDDEGLEARMWRIAQRQQGALSK